MGVERPRQAGQPDRRSHRAEQSGLRRPPATLRQPPPSGAGHSPNRGQHDDTTFRQSTAEMEPGPAPGTPRHMAGPGLYSRSDATIDADATA